MTTALRSSTFAAAFLLLAAAAGAQSGSTATPSQPPPPQSDASTRPATTTFFGDTGGGYVPTAEVRPRGKWSESAYRRGTNWIQGYTKVGDFAGTFGVGIGARTEI